MGCRQWFDAALHWCPDCDRERPRFNGHMYRAALDNSLYRAANSAHGEKLWEQAHMRGYDPPIPKHIEHSAKSVVRDM